MSSSPLLYHITTQQQWSEALQQGYYEAHSLDSEGFMHCSLESQVEGVLQRYYKDMDNLVKLSIDPALVTAPLKYELSPSINEEFPHIYGRLNLEAVVEAVDLKV